MSWIRMIPEDEADGDLKEMYTQEMTPHGVVDNIIKIHSLDPPSMRWHIDMYRQLMYGHGSRLKRAQREMIAVVVSSHNHCVY